MKRTFQFVHILLLFVFIVQITESWVEMNAILVKLDVTGIRVRERYCEIPSKCDDYSNCVEQNGYTYYCNSHSQKEFEVENELHVDCLFPISVYELLYEEKPEEYVKLGVTGTNCDIYLYTNCPKQSEVTCFEDQRLAYPVWNFTAGELDDCPSEFEMLDYILLFVILIFASILVCGFVFLCTVLLCLCVLCLDICVMGGCVAAVIGVMGVMGLMGSSRGKNPSDYIIQDT